MLYDINGEAPKISASWSEKIDKYEYLTGEEILPPDQRRVIEQAKFTYSRLQKAFEKQTKTIEDQGEKKIKAIEENKKQLCNKQPGNNELLLSKVREIFKNIYNERLDKIDELSKTIDDGELKLIISSSNTETNFSELKDLAAFLDIITKLKILIEEVRHKQEQFNRYLDKKKELKIDLKSKKKILANINKLLPEETMLLIL